MMRSRAEIIRKGLDEARERGLTEVIIVAPGKHPSRRERFELDGEVAELIEALEVFINAEWNT